MVFFCLGYAFPATSMKLPARSQPEVPLDPLQLILQRRRERAVQKGRYTLTEADGQLLGTHSKEVSFSSGQTIVEENHDITCVFRIRHGKVVVSRHGFQYHVISKGWFIGDALLVYDSKAYTMKGTMIAQGPVVLDQLNLAFVRHLFEIDSTLKVKFMRHLVSKYSVFFMNLLQDLEHPTVRALRGGMSCTMLDSAAELLTTTVSSPDDSSDDSSTFTYTSTSTIGKFVESVSSESTRSETTPHHHNIRRQDTRTRARQEQATYKTYALVSKGHGIQTIQIRHQKISVISKSFGFSFKTKIEFSKLHSISKVGENAVTIIYKPRKVTSLFFKQYYDREEFFGIVTSLTTPPQEPISPEAKRLQGRALTVVHNPDITYDVVPLCGGQDHLCKSQQTVLSLKKGDTVFEEGDLFQRIYTLLQGQCNIYQKGKQVCSMHEGDVFGVASLLYLRPCPVTLIVASETAQLVYIPAYKLNSMLDTDIVQVADLYKRASQALDQQISRAIGYLPPVVRVLERSESINSLSESSDSSTRDRSDSAVSGGWEGIELTEPARLEVG